MGILGDGVFLGHRLSCRGNDLNHVTVFPSLLEERDLTAVLRDEGDDMTLSSETAMVDALLLVTVWKLELLVVLECRIHDETAFELRSRFDGKKPDALLAKGDHRRATDQIEELRVDFREVPLGLLEIVSALPRDHPLSAQGEPCLDEVPEFLG